MLHYIQMQYILLLLISSYLFANNPCNAKSSRYGDDPPIKQKEEEKEEEKTNQYTWDLALLKELSSIELLRARHNKSMLSQQIKNDLLKQANDQKETAMKEKARVRELVIAEKWFASLTGKMDGRSWFQLTDLEKREYRAKFYSSYKVFDN